MTFKLKDEIKDYEQYLKKKISMNGIQTLEKDRFVIPLFKLAYSCKYEISIVEYL